jgi:salicylate hydroxylase
MRVKKKKPSRFFFSTTIEEITSFLPRPLLRAKPRNGDSFTVEADVLLAAGGVKSIVRFGLLKELGDDADVVDTGQSAYCIMLKQEEMQHDSELLQLLDGDIATRWIGEKRHIITYPVSSKSIYNMSTAQLDTNFPVVPSATYTTRGSKSSMLAIYADFCPQVKHLSNLVPDQDVCEWKLRVHAPLPTMSPRLRHPRRRRMPSNLASSCPRGRAGHRGRSCA